MTGYRWKSDTVPIVGRLSGAFLPQEPDTVDAAAILRRAAPRPYNGAARICLMPNFNHAGNLPPPVVTTTAGAGHGLAEIAASCLPWHGQGLLAVGRFHIRAHSQAKQ